LINSKIKIKFISPLSGIERINLLPYNRLADDKRDRFAIENRLDKIPEDDRKKMENISAKFNRAGYEVKIGG